MQIMTVRDTLTYNLEWGFNPWARHLAKLPPKAAESNIEKFCAAFTSVFYNRPRSNHQKHMVLLMKNTWLIHEKCQAILKRCKAFFA